MSRHISLYWASISLGTSFRVLLLWLICFWRRPANLRAALMTEVRKAHGNGAWYAFGSARSGLACFLETFLQPGDEVIVSAYTCLAVPTGLVASGVVPVYVDIDPRTLALDEGKLWEAVTPKTKAIVVQHTLGNPAPIQEIRRRAKEAGLLVIEDCALSLGTRINDQCVGTFGDAAIFSMELSKTLSCGWGGLLLVNNSALVAGMDQAYAGVPEQTIVQSTRDLVQTVISTWCSHPRWVNFPGKYVMWLCWKIGLFRPSTPNDEFKGIVAFDFLHKMGRAQTVLATFQWRRFTQITQACSENHAYFFGELQKLGYEVHVPKDAAIRPVANRVSFLVQDREKILEYFRVRHIELGAWFDGPLSPVPSATVFNYMSGFQANAEKVARHVVNLPCHNRLSDKDIKEMIQVLRTFAQECPDSLGV